MKKNFFTGAIALCFAILPTYLIAKNVNAASVNADNIEVKVYAKQGGDWFRAIKKETTRYGTLKLRKMLPGKYKLEVDEDDEQTPQTLDVEAQMYDEKGREFDEKVDVSFYAYIDATALPSAIPGDDKVLVGIYETNKDGEISLESVVPGIIYEVETDEEASLSKKKDRPRVKIKAKIDESDWFYVAYERIDTTNTLKLKDVISGKYKFKYKEGDVADPMQRFNLYIRLRDEDGEKIEKSKKVKLYAYINDQKVPVGEFMTTKDGKLYLPNVMPGEYKIEVK